MTLNVIEPIPICQNMRVSDSGGVLYKHMTHRAECSRPTATIALFKQLN